LPAILRLLAEKSPEVTLGSVLADPSLGGAARAMTLREFARALSVGPVGPAPRLAASALPAPRPAAPRLAAPRLAAPRLAAGATPRLADAARGPRPKEYDAAILIEILAAAGPVGPTAVRAKVGGTPAAFRAAIERLVAAGKVKALGSARAPRYRAG
jgi:hypothetical protein